MDIRRITAGALAALLCLGLCACEEGQGPEPSAPSRPDKPIMTVATQPPEEQGKNYTPVYATAFGDTVYLATVPLTAKEEQEPSCELREVSLGGQVHCGELHEWMLEKDVAVTRVVIMEELYPKSTAGWFRGMATLVTVEGLEKLHTQEVTSMREMFSGCASLASLEGADWDVSAVTDMDGIFDGCDALAERPDWYQTEEPTEPSEQVPAGTVADEGTDP